MTARWPPSSDPVLTSESSRFPPPLPASSPSLQRAPVTVWESNPLRRPAKASNSSTSTCGPVGDNVTSGNQKNSPDRSCDLDPVPHYAAYGSNSGANGAAARKAFKTRSHECERCTHECVRHAVMVAKKHHRLAEIYTTTWPKFTPRRAPKSTRCGGSGRGPPRSRDGRGTSRRRMPQRPSGQELLNRWLGRLS
jgi:hypothetical protein